MLRNRTLRARAGAPLLALVRALVVLMTLSAGAANDAAASSAPRGVVYTANERGNSVSAVDLATGKTTTVDVRIVPHNVQASADGRLLLAAGPLAKDEHGHAHGDGRGRLLVLDARDLAAGPIADIEVGRHPAHVVVDEAGRRAFVTNAEDATVSVVDLARGRVLKAFATGAYPHGLRLSPDGRELYVANEGTGENPDNRVSIISVAQGEVVATVVTGKGAHGVAVSADGGQAFVTNIRDATVSAIDTATRAVVATYAVGAGPNGVTYRAN